MINVAVVGCGRIAKRHIELLGNNHIEGAKLVAICDINPDKEKEYSLKYNVPFFIDMDEMMSADLNVDLVSVLTESGNHAKHVINLAKYKKHILVEKPMALSLKDADDMINACDRNNIKLFVVKQNRFNIPVQKLRQAVEADRFGKIFLGTIRVRWCRPQEYYDQDSWRGTWALDGGVLTNQASHHVDLLEWMLGDVESVYAKSITALAKIEVEDTAVVLLKFTSGALGVIEATTAIRPKDLEGSISILGEKGSVEIGGFAVNKMLHWNFNLPVPEDTDVLEKYSENPPDVYGFGHKTYYDHVIDCIVNNKQQLVDGLEGRRSLELITAIYESIETGKEVFMRFSPKKCRLGCKNE